MGVCVGVCVGVSPVVILLSLSVEQCFCGSKFDSVCGCELLCDSYA